MYTKAFVNITLKGFHKYNPRTYCAGVMYLSLSLLSLSLYYIVTFTKLNNIFALYMLSISIRLECSILYFAGTYNGKHPSGAITALYTYTFIHICTYIGNHQGDKAHMLNYRIYAIKKSKALKIHSSRAHTFGSYLIFPLFPCPFFRIVSYMYIYNISVSNFSISRLYQLYIYNALIACVWEVSDIFN